MTNLFAAALDGDAAANETLRHLAPWDTAAADAFEAIGAVELERQLRSQEGQPRATPTAADLVHADEIMAAVDAYCRPNAWLRFHQ